MIATFPHIYRQSDSTSFTLQHSDSLEVKPNYQEKSLLNITNHQNHNLWWSPPPVRMVTIKKINRSAGKDIEK
jgi:hypothetical protein